ncbi:hypothetical protein ILUMI_24760, partial [Ignelater luminosus]
MELGYVLNSVPDVNQPLSSKIPRPANAFMIYANENRKKMAQMYPQESNKEISKRLGVSWKSLDVSEKKRYFELAKTVDAEHKKKYPDYVYNPKEARIRKAMREASRERAVGAAPIPSPRGGRRSQTWTNTPEEQLMMAPSPELGGPLCGSPIFPGPTPPAVGQFMQPINTYTKLVHVLPSSGWLQDSPTYLQHNPMAELQQHQATMWQQYQEPMRPPCTGPTYMLDSQINLYQEVNPSDVLPQKKCKSEVDAFPTNSSVPTNATPPPPPPPPPKSDSEKVVKIEKMEENNKETTVDDTQTLVDSTNIEQSETFLPVFQETVVVQNPFDKDDDMKLKKPPVPPLKRNGSRQSIKALPDFNEAFGSTERGRFQSPPDPRLAPNKSYLDCFFLNDGINLGPFDETKEDINGYLLRLKHYLKVNDVESTYRVSVLLATVGPELVSLLQDLCSPIEVDKKSYQELTDILVNHFKPAKLIIDERFKFNTRVQQQEESISEFVVALKHLAKTMQLRLRTAESDFDETLKKALMLEEASKNANLFSASEPTLVNKIQANKNASKFNNYNKYKSVQCTVCSKMGHSQSVCRYKTYKCNLCSEKGHLRSMCPKNPKKNHYKSDIHMVTEKVQELSLYNVHQVSLNQVNPPIQLTVSVNGKKVLFDLDTGCAFTLLSEEVYEACVT